MPRHNGEQFGSAPGSRTERALSPEAIRRTHLQEMHARATAALAELEKEKRKPAFATEAPIRTSYEHVPQSPVEGKRKESTKAERPTSENTGRDAEPAVYDTANTRRDPEKRLNRDTRIDLVEDTKIADTSLARAYEAPDVAVDDMLIQNAPEPTLTNAAVPAAEQQPQQDEPETDEVLAEAVEDKKTEPAAKPQRVVFNTPARAATPTRPPIHAKAPPLRSIPLSAPEARVLAAEPDQDEMEQSLLSGEAVGAFRTIDESDILAGAAAGDFGKVTQEQPVDLSAPVPRVQFNKTETGTATEPAMEVADSDIETEELIEPTVQAEAATLPDVLAVDTSTLPPVELTDDHYRLYQRALDAGYSGKLGIQDYFNTYRQSAELRVERMESKKELSASREALKKAEARLKQFEGLGKGKLATRKNRMEYTAAKANADKAREEYEDRRTDYIKTGALRMIKEQGIMADLAREAKDISPSAFDKLYKGWQKLGDQNLGKWTGWEPTSRTGKMIAKGVSLRTLAGIGLGTAAAFSGGSAALFALTARRMMGGLGAGFGSYAFVRGRAEKTPPISKDRIKELSLDQMVLEMEKREALGKRDETYYALKKEYVRFINQNLKETVPTMMLAADQRLEQSKISERNRKLLAVGVGALVGSGAVAKAVRGAYHLFSPPAEAADVPDIQKHTPSLKTSQDTSAPASEQGAPGSETNPIRPFTPEERQAYLEKQAVEHTPNEGVSTADAHVMLEAKQDILRSVHPDTRSLAAGVTPDRIWELRSESLAPEAPPLNDLLAAEGLTNIGIANEDLLAIVKTGLAEDGTLRTLQDLHGNAITITDTDLLKRAARLALHERGLTDAQIDGSALGDSASVTNLPVEKQPISELPEPEPKPPAELPKESPQPPKPPVEAAPEPVQPTRPAPIVPQESVPRVERPTLLPEQVRAEQIIEVRQALAPDIQKVFDGLKPEQMKEIVAHARTEGLTFDKNTAIMKAQFENLKLSDESLKKLAFEPSREETGALKLTDVNGKEVRVFRNFNAQQAARQTLRERGDLLPSEPSSAGSAPDQTAAGPADTKPSALDVKSEQAQTAKLPEREITQQGSVTQSPEGRTVQSVGESRGPVNMAELVSGYLKENWRSYITGEGSIKNPSLAAKSIENQLIALNDRDRALAALIEAGQGESQEATALKVAIKNQSALINRIAGSEILK